MDALPTVTATAAGPIVTATAIAATAVAISSTAAVVAAAASDGGTTTATSIAVTGCRRLRGHFRPHVRQLRRPAKILL